jgi:hypothetical protein
VPPATCGWLLNALPKALPAPVAGVDPKSRFDHSDLDCHLLQLLLALASKPLTIARCAVIG